MLTRSHLLYQVLRFELAGPEDRDIKEFYIAELADRTNIRIRQHGACACRLMRRNGYRLPYLAAPDAVLLLRQPLSDEMIAADQDRYTVHQVGDPYVTEREAKRIVQSYFEGCDGRVAYCYIEV